MMKQELLKIICEKSFQYNEKPIFTLASGKKSCFYINCKPTTLSPRGMYLIGNLIFEAIKGTDVQGVGGLTFGADPIAIATAFTSELKQKPMKAFSIRKQQKDHGIIKWIEGDMQKGDKVVIVEDVVTTGGSTLKAIERAHSEGLNVIKVVTLIDRQEENGIEKIKNHVNNVTAIITKDELIEFIKQKIKESL